jgi:hypothetical protein
MSERTPTSVPCSRVSGASRSCRRTSPCPSDDCATPATAGHLFWILVPIAGIFVLITLWMQPTKPAVPATTAATA